MEASERNPYEGIEYIPSTDRFAAFRNRWAPFPLTHFIGTYPTLELAISARADVLARKANG